METYNNEERERWVESFQPNFEKLSWRSDKVYHPTEIACYPFFKEHKKYMASINPAKISGIEYAYAYNCPSKGPNNTTWDDLLHNLIRLDRVIRNFKNIESLTTHIHSDEDSKAVYKFGDHYFTFSGQHRLCLAKYFEVELVEVFVIEYKFDKKTWVREKRVEKIFPELKKLRLVEDETYTLNANADDHYVCLFLDNDFFFLHKSLIPEVVSRFSQLRKNRLSGIYNMLKTHFKNTSEINRLDTVKDLYMLDGKILRHIKNKL